MHDCQLGTGMQESPCSHYLSDFAIDIIDYVVYITLLTFTCPCMLYVKPAIVHLQAYLARSVNYLRCFLHPVAEALGNNSHVEVFTHETNYWKDFFYIFGNLTEAARDMETLVRVFCLFILLLAVYWL